MPGRGEHDFSSFSSNYEFFYYYFSSNFYDDLIQTLDDYLFLIMISWLYFEQNDLIYIFFTITYFIFIL